MAKFHGLIGYGISSETSPGIYEEEIVEKSVRGEILQNYKKTDPGDGPIDDISISNRFSFVANPYAMQHFHLMKYIKWRGVAWKVSAVTVEFPRLIINVGSIYNGPTARIA